jgi:hypothetical protein
VLMKMFNKLSRMALDKGRQVENDARHNIIYDRSDALL